MKKVRFLRVALVLAALAVLPGAVLNSAMTTSNSRALSVKAAYSAVDAIALFNEKCAMCHSKNGAGLPNWKAKGQPDFTNAEWQTSHTDAQIAAAIRDGKGKYMPVFKGKLSEEEIVALAGRVRAFAKKR
jgi:mono/diheme cytochrome c family protein